MSDASSMLNYREPGVARPMRAPLVRRIESSTTIAIIALLLVIMPGLYKVGAIDIIVVNQLGRFLCYAIVALGIDLIWGYCGILSLCQAMFFCLGGYAIGMHMALHGPLDGAGIPRCLYVVTSVVEGFELPGFWKPFRTLGAAIFLGMAIPGLVAFIFGYFTFRSRVRGVYFSIITQATVVAACLIFRRNETRLCGTNGLTNFETLAGFDLRLPSTRLGLYYITVLALIAVFLACRYVIGSRLGRLLLAVRDNESRLRFAGFQPVTIKAFAFTAAGVIAGIGGMLYAPQNGIITPYKMEPKESIVMVLWVAIGGRGTLTGAVLGALLINYTESTLTSWLPSAWPFVEGGLFVGVVLLFPDGLMGAWRNVTRGDRRPAAATTAAIAAEEVPSTLEGARS